jgi:TRAP-type C4-dicarboxylate transport system substrate-binding protein
MKKRNPLFFLASCIGSILMFTFLFFSSPPQVMANSIQLSFALHLPPKAAPYRNALAPWAQEIEKETNGKVKIKFYLSQTLVKSRDMYKAVVSGIADMAWAQHSFTPKRFPLISVMELPFMSPSSKGGTQVLGELYEKFPKMRAEHKDVHLLYLWCSLPYEIHTTNKPVRTLEDIKGLKIACPPGAVPAVRALGAVPVAMGPPKLYPTVEKGVADGVALAWGAFKAWKLYEVTKYHTNAHLSGLTFWAAMNKKTWERLPQDIQAKIDGVTPKMMPAALTRAVTDEMNMGIEEVRKRDHEVIELTTEEWEKWRAKGKPAWDEWVKELESKRLPGREVLDETVKRLVESRSR